MAADVQDLKDVSFHMHFIFLKKDPVTTGGTIPTGEVNAMPAEDRMNAE